MTADPVLDVVVPPGGYLGVAVRPEQVLRIEDIEGKQIAHLTMFRTEDPRDVYSAHVTRVMQARWKLGVGDVLWSDTAEQMMTIVEDSIGGHFSGGGYCSAEINYKRYGLRNTPNCRDNLLAAAESLGLAPCYVPGAFAPFMNYELRTDGTTAINEPISVPGDHIAMRAEVGLLVAISACPQDRNVSNAYRQSPIRVTVLPP